jgi:uncharacterized membrane protein YdbT with pleckstrin-like domain
MLLGRSRAVMKTASDTVGYAPAMPYPTKLLNDDETISVDLHPHWFHFLEPGFALVGSIVLGIVALALDGTLGTVLGWISLVLIIGTALWLVARYITWSTSHFVVTNHRIIYRSGWIRKNGIDIPLDRVNNVLNSQGVFERMFGAGDLIIESAGESGQQGFHDIMNPQRVQNQIYAQIQLDKAAQRSPAAAAATDVATQLEKLEGMLQRGTLSPEEFENEKRRLLG